LCAIFLSAGSKPIDKNELLNNYSASMGNSEHKFISFAKDNGINNYTVFIDEFKSIQNQVYDYIVKMTEPDLKLSAEEIEAISYKFCASNIEWMNSKGIKALNRWLIWMCWHEGILKKDE
jgi:hypothetical protein